MKRAVLTLIVLLVTNLAASSIALIPQAQAAGTVKFWLGPAAQNVSQGSTFKMAVNLTTYTQAVDTVSVQLTYPAGKLSCVGVANTPDFTLTPQPDSCSGGNILIQRGRIGNHTSDAMIAVVTFQAVTQGSANVEVMGTSQALTGGEEVTYTMEGSAYQVITGPATYGSQYAGQSNYPTIIHGSSADAYLQYKNTGNQHWYDDTTAASNLAKPVHLATNRPINRFSLVGTHWGGGQNRPTATLAQSNRNFEAVYESDGTTLSANQHIVQPGQIARFGIKFFGPTNLSPGTYREFFQPIVEGGTTMNDPGTFLDIAIVSVIYASQYAGQSPYPVVAKGQTVSAFLRYKNIGNQPWHDDTTASANQAKPVHLSTSRPINRFSLVGTAWGGNQNRPALQFAAVYEADGTTPAANQHTAQPGQIIQFNIAFFGPTNLSPGTYREFFQPIVEGGTTMNDPGTFLDVTLTP